MLEGGSIAAMVQSIRNNRNLLKKKHRSYREDHPTAQWKHRKLSYKQVPAEQTQQFLRRFKEEKKRERIIRILLWVIGITFTALIFYLIT